MCRLLIPGANSRHSARAKCRFNIATCRHCGIGTLFPPSFAEKDATLDAIDRRLMESSQKRKTTQPIAASAGCIFKNPRECPAGKLVEELGLKNRRVGAARVSEVHGNFIVNDGGARAEEILQLIAEIQSIAKEQRGIDLQTEVQIVGVDDE